MSQDERPFAPACERNKQVILQQLTRHFAACQQILEIGSGTGQHAAYFARHLPHLNWQPTDMAEQQSGIALWVRQAQLANLHLPETLNICNDQDWPQAFNFDGVFSANTLHIVAWQDVKVLFRQLGQRLNANSVFCVYGPFNYKKAYTSESNAHFDQWLKNRDPNSAIRDFEAVQILASQAGFVLLEDKTMPANNRLLVWNKT